MMRKIVCFNSLATILLAAVFFLYPAIRAGLDLRDRALEQPGIPKMAWRLYKNLTPRYATWARDRVQQGQAEGLPINDIAGTEWPLFGSVFYLWAIENLQTAWDGGDHTGGVEPKVFARDAIVASSELVIDPKHASWVKKHWGTNYLHQENVFYRMLVMAALTTRAKLLKDNAHLDLLRDQVESFASELDATSTGLLDDYPGECYPGDVLAAIACIKRADAVLGTDHSAFVSRASRGFSGARLTRLQLPPYSAASGTGLPTSEAQGCANAYVCLIAPELWPARARQWFELYDKFFWQERLTAVGYREHPKGDARSEWGLDVDAGPIIAGHGVAASAFGIGAARKNGRFDRAYPLTTELLVSVGELPNGMLLIPRLLSDLSDAPYLGEAAILWQLTVQPEKGVSVRPAINESTPTYTYIVLAGVFIFGLWRILAAAGSLRQTLRRSSETPERIIPAPGFQSVVWAGIMLIAIGAFLLGFVWPGLAAFAVGVTLPVTRKRKPPTGAEDWPEEEKTKVKELGS